MMKENYSEGEFKLLNSLGFGNLIKQIENTPSVYRIAVEKCFIEDLKGPNVEALRRAYKAINKCNPYRMTPEFEELIKF